MFLFTFMCFAFISCVRLFFILGNSTSAIMDGFANLTLLPHGEDYVISMPYAHCKGRLKVRL